MSVRVNASSFTTCRADKGSSKDILVSGAGTYRITLSESDLRYTVTPLTSNQAPVAALSPKTKAVMIAHTLGNPFDLSAVKAFCDAHNLWLVEDNCDALGTQYTINGETRFTGTWGDIGTSSFYPPLLDFDPGGALGALEDGAERWGLGGDAHIAVLVERGGGLLWLHKDAGIAKGGEFGDWGGGDDASCVDVSGSCCASNSHCGITSCKA
jgi:hypothetical protein